MRGGGGRFSVRERGRKKEVCLGWFGRIDRQIDRQTNRYIDYINRNFSYIYIYIYI